MGVRVSSVESHPSLGPALEGIASTQLRPYTPLALVLPLGLALHLALLLALVLVLVLTLALALAL